MPFFSALRFQFLSLFNQKNSLVMLSIFLIYGVSSFFIYGVESSLFESVYFVFYAPRAPIIDLLRALLFILSFIIICSNFIQSEVSGKNHSILLRLKSTKVYFHSLFITMLFYVFLFVLLCYFVIALLFLIFSKIEVAQSSFNFATIDGYALIRQYILVSLSIIMLLFMNYIFILLVRKAEIATFLILILFVSAFNFVSSHFKQSIYIPFLYGFFEPSAIMEVENYILKIVIACVSNIFLYIICYWINQRKKDVFS